MKLSLSMITLVLVFMSAHASAALRVLTCEPEWQSLVETLGGEHVKAFSATTAFQDPHYIEARPSLIAKARRADLLVCTGAELEIGWLPVLVRQSGNAKIQQDQPGYFLAAAQVERIEIPAELDRSQGDLHASGNPHVHWDPYRLLTIAKALTKRLIMLDEENALHYEQRLSNFESQWNQAVTQWEATASQLKGTNVIVYHKNWSYLLNWLGVNTVADLEPKSGIPPTSAHLAKLLEITRTSKIDFIMITNYQDDKGAQWLSKKSGIPVKTLPFTVGGTKEATNLFTLYNAIIKALTRET